MTELRVTLGLAVAALWVVALWHALVPASVDHPLASCGVPLLARDDLTGDSDCVEASRRRANQAELWAFVALPVSVAFLASLHYDA